MTPQTCPPEGSDAGSSAKARGMLKLARERMLRRYPFHARFLARGQAEEDDGIGTMAVTLRDGTLVFLHNPAFVVGCSLDELVGVLLHECGHVLFEHLLEDPAKYPHRQARMLAEELCVNEWIREPLPGAPITLAMFPELPPNEDTATRYRRLRDRKTLARDRKNVRSSQNGSGSISNSTVDDGRDRPLDDHSVWDSARRSGALNAMALRVAVRETMNALTPGEIAKIPANLRTRIAEMTHGDHPGVGEEALSASLPRSDVDWRRLLRHHVSHAVESRSSLARPSRRFPHLVGVVPGRVHAPTRARVMAVIDTSGSIDGETLQHIVAELTAMHRHHDVVVVECDAKIHGIYPFDGNVTTLRGRGGTDLRPPFAREVLQRVRPDVMVYFTDGHGPAPQQPSPVPVVWCIAPNGQRPAPWGREVRLGLPTKQS